MTVWQGNSVVTCKNTYSIRYRFYLLACRNPRNQLAIVGTSYVKVTTDDGSFAFPDQATAMYPGDYWRSGRLQCRVFGYGRVRCYSLTSSTQGFEIARSYAIPMTFS